MQYPIALISFSPVIALLEAVNGSDAVLDHELAKIMDVEQFLRVYAARCAHDDWDTVAIGNGQNAYFYWAPEEGRMIAYFRPELDGPISDWLDLP